MDKYATVEAHQSTLNSKWKQDERKEVCRKIGQFTFARALPFNTVTKMWNQLRNKDERDWREKERDWRFQSAWIFQPTRRFHLQKFVSPWNTYSQRYLQKSSSTQVVFKPIVPNRKDLIGKSVEQSKARRCKHPPKSNRFVWNMELDQENGKFESMENGQQVLLLQLQPQTYWIFGIFSWTRLLCLFFFPLSIQLFVGWLSSLLWPLIFMWLLKVSFFLSRWVSMGKVLGTPQHPFLY